MKRQNKTLGVITIFSITVLGGILWKTGTLEGEFSLANKKPKTSVAARILIASDHQDERRVFQKILSDLASCLGFKASVVPSDLKPIAIETLGDFVQGDLGEPVSQNDRWMTWDLRTRDGHEKHLRLEILHLPDGTSRREVHASLIDRDGFPVPIEMEPGKTFDPSTEIIKQMLREGSVVYKERASTINFKKAQIFVVEIDDGLSSFEVQGETASFKCPSLRMPASCDCRKGL